MSAMKLLKTDQGIVLDVYVKPDSREFRIEIEDDELVVLCKESPVKDKVNRELMKELSKVFRTKVEIASGFASKHKRVLITDIDLEKVDEILSAYKSY